MNILRSMLLIYLWLISTGYAHAETTEYDIKAAFIYNFAKFVEWQESAVEGNNDLTLCVLGKDPFGQALNTLRNREIRDRKIKIQKARSIPKDWACDIVFISKSEEKNLPAVISEFSNTDGILLVSDIRGFVDLGGSIELRISNNKVRFAINRHAIRQAKLSVSSKLLQLAEDLVDREARS